MGRDGTSQRQKPPWLLVTSHGLVLTYIGANPDKTIREISEALGLTQRRVVAVVKDLAASGLLEVERRGRRNHYRIPDDARFLHPTMTHIRVADFVALMRADAPNWRG